MVSSISYDQQEIIKNILELHVPSKKIDCDPTYSVGNFYKNTKIAEPTYKYDILPQRDGVEFGDSRNLPLKSNSLNCIMFDPPFLATTGKSLKENNKNNNIINKRFGCYPDEKSLHRFYVDSLQEFYRILKEHGVLIFKCQDKVSSGKQFMTHVFIMNYASKIGFYPKDLFILLSKNRITANWQIKNQKHARKYHCYFLVFEKNRKKIDYI